LIEYEGQQSQMSIIRIGSLGIIALIGLTACDREVILEGERFGTRVPLQDTVPGDDDVLIVLDEVSAAVDASRAINLPAPVSHTSWPQRSGTAQNIYPPAALSAAPSELWAVDIGAGNSRRNRLTADPVVADGQIFTLDALAQVSATSTSGQIVWQVDLTPGFERGGGISGGGLAVVDGTVFATTGYGELVALDAASGAVQWRQRLSAGMTAPTIANDTVYVVSRDSQAWAINAENGRVRWQLPAAAAGAVLSGSVAPAVSDRLVIFPFGSGELVAVLRLSGIRVWGTTVAGSRRGFAYNNLNDITGDPVISGSTLYAGNQSGRVVAMNAASGERIWTAQDGAYSPVLPVDDSIFFVSDRNELLRVDAANGDRIWGVDLPLYVQRRERRRQAVFTHFGPIMAGGQLIVPSGDGAIRFFAPEDGSLTNSLEIRGGAASNPIVVGDVLYVVSGDGRLHAFR
jgi:outer membrane protein assembly factor BamB